MTPEQIQALEDEILVLESARDAKTGVRVMETDPIYRRDVFSMRVELSEAKAESDEIARHEVHIGDHLLHGLSRYDFNRDDPDVKTLQRALGAVNPATGNRWVVEKPELRAEVEDGLRIVLAGGDEGRVTPSQELSDIIRGVK